MPPVLACGDITPRAFRLLLSTARTDPHRTALLTTRSHLAIVCWASEQPGLNASREWWGFLHLYRDGHDVRLRDLLLLAGAGVSIDVPDARLDDPHYHGVWCRRAGRHRMLCIPRRPFA